MKRPGLTAGLATAALLLSLAGARAQDAVVAGETIATPEQVKAACAEGAVTYYTAQSDEDEREIVKPFIKRFPCIKVSVISAVTGRLFERMSTEALAGKVVGDVAMLTDDGLAKRLQEANVLRPFNAVLGNKYPATARRDGWYYAGSSTFLLIDYNPDQVEAKDAPKNWPDILDPKWKGKIVAAPITIGGSAYVLYAFLAEKYGRDFLVKLAAQQPAMMPSYNPVVMGVARGEYQISLAASLNEYSIRVGQGAPVAPVYPPDGQPYTNYPIMLLANAPHPAAGELFANWYLSKEGQAALVAQRGAYSLRDDVPPAKGNPPRDKLSFWSPGVIPADKRDAFQADVLAIFGAK